MEISFVDLKAQYFEIKDEIDNAMKIVVNDTSFIGGRPVVSFEQKLAAYIGVKFCIGVGNGTDALFVALKCLGIKQGDEVITVANTFIATSEAITMTGARVVFIDCDSRTYNIDLNQIEKAITPRTRAIVSVHLYGQPAALEPILAIARKHHLFVVEDAAQAHGAEYKDRKVGTFGDCACFSFFPGKNLGAYGDGGAIVTNDEALAQKMRMFANHGRIEKYNHEIEGINSRLDSLQASILDVKLKYLDCWNKKRMAIAKIYDQGLKDIVVTPFVLSDVKHVYHLYVVRVKDRAKVMGLLKAKGISTGIHYPIPLPFLNAYNYLGHKPEDFPNAFAIKDEILSLPIHGSMPEEQAWYVIEQLKKIVTV